MSLGWRADTPALRSRPWLRLHSRQHALANHGCISHTVAVPTPSTAEIGSGLVHDSLESGLAKRIEHEDAGEATADYQSVDFQIVGVRSIGSAAFAILSELTLELRIRHRVHHLAWVAHSCGVVVVLLRIQWKGKRNAVRMLSESVHAEPSLSMILLSISR